MKNQVTFSLLLLAAFAAVVAPALGAQESSGAEPAEVESSGPAGTAAAEDPSVRVDPGILRFEVERTSSSVAVDGRLSEPAWEDALVIPLPYEWFPGDNVEPPVATECLVTYDSANVYVAFRAYDPEPRQIRAHLMDRDNARFFQNDHVGFQFDPFNDERRAFQFRINPLGVQVDAVFSEIDQLEDFSWDAIWASAGRITADGYVVEAAVPLEQLRFPRADAPQTWGFEAFRSWPRSARHRISSKFTDRDKDCTLCQENKISGWTDIQPGLNLEIDPTLTVLRTDVREDFPQGDLRSGGEDYEPGLYARWGITPNMTVAGTVNPDFSHVEADAAQLEINTRFALSFPEKRPFFLEGADFFTTPIEAVFTRTVANPEWGAKVTGKEGKHAVGAFIARDRQNNLLVPSNQGSRFVFLDEEVTSSVLRYRRDVGSSSTLGVLYTGRESGGYHNDVYGLDGFLRLDNSNAVRFQYLRSDTAYPTAGGLAGADLSGDGWLLQYNHLSQGWIADLSYTDLDPAFRADSGFVPRVDVRTARAGVTRRLWGDGASWYDQLAFGFRGQRVEDHEGVQTDESLLLFADYQGPRQTFVELFGSVAEERFLGTVYDTDRYGLTFQIRPTGDLTLFIQSEAGNAIDFTNARQGEVLEIRPGMDLRLGRHLNLELDHVRQTLDVEGGELFQVDLSQLLLVYQFNVRTFVRAVLQYQTVDRDTDLYTVPVSSEQEDLFSQLLLSYEVNPQTVVYLGYSDNRLGFDQFSLTQSDRTFFFKVGYAFLF